jgi:hypothetical protein
MVCNDNQEIWKKNRAFAVPRNRWAIRACTRRMSSPAPVQITVGFRRRNMAVFDKNIDFPT